MYRFLLATALSVVAAPAWGKYTICTATLNSSEEREVFRAKLDPRDFDFRELTSAPGSPETDWFTRACQSDVKCDVLVVSGHFAGYFFGQLGLTLDLKTLEQRACQQSCPGVLGRLREAYLFGCNTLASKSSDARTPEQYLAVLLGDGIPRPEAERIVAARYGPFGSSYRDRMERIFENTPIIYGFNSVGPSGANVKTSLGRYFDKLGNYKDHLDRVRPGIDNPTWTETMSAYARARGTGLTKAHPLYPVKENMCALEDDRRTIAERVGIVADLLDRDPMLYLTAIASFANANLSGRAIASLGAEDARDVRSSLKQMVQRTDLERTFAKVQASAGVTPSIRVDLLGAARNIGWITDPEFERRVRDLFEGYTRALDADGADFLCAQVDHDAKLAQYFDESDLLGYRYDRWFQFRLASCSGQRNPRLTAAAIAGFERNAGALSRLKIEQRFWILAAMITLPEEDAGRARVLRTFLSYRGPHEDLVINEARKRLVGLTVGEEQTALLRHVLKGAKAFDDLSVALDGLAGGREPNVEATRIATDAIFGFKHADLGDALLPRGIFGASTTVEGDLARRLLKSDLAGHVALAMEGQPHIRSAALIDRFIAWLARPRSNSSYADSMAVQAITALLDASDLSSAQVEALRTIYVAMDEASAPYLRWVLAGKNVDETSVRTGLKLLARCTRQELSRNCSFLSKY